MKEFIKEEWRTLIICLVIIIFIGRCTISQISNEEIVINDKEESSIIYDPKDTDDYEAINCSEYNPPIEFDINYFIEYWECGGKEEIEKRDVLYTNYEKEMDEALERFYASIDKINPTNNLTISLPSPPEGYCGKYKRCIDGKYNFRYSEDFVQPYYYEEREPYYDDRWIDEW